MEIYFWWDLFQPHDIDISELQLRLQVDNPRMCCELQIRVELHWWEVLSHVGFLKPRKAILNRENNFKLKLAARFYRMHKWTKHEENNKPFRYPPRSSHDRWHLQRLQQHKDGIRKCNLDRRLRLRSQWSATRFRSLCPACQTRMWTRLFGRRTSICR
jgi:hypothetical protein